MIPKISDRKPRLSNQLVQSSVLDNKSSGTYTVKPLFKGHPLEEHNLVFLHMCSLIITSFMQKMNNWGIKSVFGIDRELLNNRFNCL